MNQLIVSAIEGKYLLQFSYEGKARVVEPHCYGVNTKGNVTMRAFQVDGYSSSGAMGWKMYDVNKIGSLEILESKFENPRDGYVKGDSHMSVIYVEL